MTAGTTTDIYQRNRRHLGVSDWRQVMTRCPSQDWDTHCQGQEYPDDICYLDSCQAPLKDGPYNQSDPEEYGYCSYGCWFTSDPAGGTTAFPGDCLVWHNGREVSRALLAAAREEGLLPVLKDEQHDVAVGIMKRLLAGRCSGRNNMDTIDFMRGAANAAASGVNWHDLITADRKFRELAPDDYNPKRTGTWCIQTRHRKVVANVLVAKWSQRVRKNIRKYALEQAVLAYQLCVDEAGLGSPSVALAQKALGVRS